MLTVRIFVVGRTRASFLREGEAFYLSRIGRYCRTDWVELRPASPRLPQRDILAIEAEAVFKRLSPRDYLIGLDKAGTAYDSPGFARRIASISLETSSICFITGGSLGLSEGILDACNERISVSRMTLTHEMIRLLLLEQIYRAFTILNNERYHK